jgi:integrase
MDEKRQQKRNRNGGIRKRCGCPAKAWTKCSHPWHFNFKWAGVHYRLSLDREAGRRIDSKSEAQAEADRIRTMIRNGAFRAAVSVATDTPLTFAQFAGVWKEQRGVHLVRPRDNEYRLDKITAFVLPGTMPTLTFGEKALKDITTNDIEAFRDARKAAGLSAVTVNHDLKLLRKMFNWAIRKSYVERTPFKIATVSAITLDREIPRSKRFEEEGDEQKLLDGADPHLRGVLIALLDTACRVGEVLSLQWKNVNIERREIVIEAVKSKTRTARIVPISKRLMGILEMRRHDPSGQLHRADAYVFGTEVGEQVKSVRDAWEKIREAAGLPDLQLRDLRHEAGSRFDDAGVPTNYVSKLLGHTNLTTTSRYLNIHRRGLHMAMRTVEDHRARHAGVAQPLHTDEDASPAVVPGSAEHPADKPLPS